ncbi:uncharacterized protein [Palaemon carinicauda]|uniref:uncharacterized protein n=1 Tax=Palaemon carinicauda TaxID=392227 RepID=UPI0035B60868
MRAVQDGQDAKNWKFKGCPDNQAGSDRPTPEDKVPQKRDVMECGNHRGIELIEHCMKFFERVLDESLREIVQILKQQYGFMRGKGTVDAIFIASQPQEKRLEENQKLMIEIMFRGLRKRRVPERFVRMVQIMYKRTRIKVITVVGETVTFEVSVGLHQ